VPFERRRNSHDGKAVSSIALDAQVSAGGYVLECPAVSGPIHFPLLIITAIGRPASNCLIVTSREIDNRCRFDIHDNIGRPRVHVGSHGEGGEKKDEQRREKRSW